MRKHSELHPCGSFRLVTGSLCVMCAWPFAALNSIRNRLPRVTRLPLCCVAMAMEPPKRRRIWAKRPPLPHEELQAPAAQPALAAEAAPAGHRRRQVFCPGRGPEQPCCFAADGSGRAAKGTRDGCCSFCHRDNMDTALGTARGRKIVARLLRQWRLMAPNIFEAAFNQSVLAEIDGATRESLRAQVSEPMWEVRHANHQWRAPMNNERGASWTGAGSRTQRCWLACCLRQLCSCCVGDLVQAWVLGLVSPMCFRATTSSEGSSFTRRSQGKHHPLQELCQKGRQENMDTLTRRCAGCASWLILGPN